MRGSSLARKPFDERRRQKLRDALIAEYRPTTALSTSWCDTLASVLERLGATKAGTLDHARLLEESKTLGGLLEASRPRNPQADDDVDAMSIDDLINDTSTTLRGLLELQDAEARAKTGLPGVGVSLGLKPNDEGTPAPAGPEAGASPDPSRAPSPEPDCPYCHRPCVGPEHDAYDVLHWDDPVEVDKRAARATAEMMESMRRARSGDFPTW